LSGPETRVAVLVEIWLRSHGYTGAGHETSKSAICARRQGREQYLDVILSKV